MSDDPYLYPRTCTLKNRLGIRDLASLDKAERLLSSDRAAEGVPRGDFDLAHLKTIHRHLFQDIYDWAGEIRTVEISKGGSQFMLRHHEFARQSLQAKLYSAPFDVQLGSLGRG